MFDMRLDYLDLQGERQRQGSYKVKEKDEDGIEYESTVMTYDGLALQFFSALNLIPHSATRHSRGEYFTEERDIFWVAYEYKFSLQFKGGFFLRTDYKDLLELALKFFKERNITVSVSRTDLGFAFSFKSDFFKELMKGDYKSLLVKTIVHKKKTVYFIAKNSRVEIVGYSKTNHLKKLKNNSYKERFYKSLGIDSSFEEEIFRIDLRLRQKAMNTFITDELHKEKINFEAIESGILKQIAKRVSLPKKIRDALKIKRNRKAKSPFRSNKETNL